MMYRKDDTNLDFEDMIMESDLRYYLKASPLETGERSRMDSALTEEYYFDNLYAHTESAESLIHDIMEEISHEDTHNFILSGYKGCGKSTFVRYFLRTHNLRDISIYFDKNVEPDIGIIHNLALYLDSLIHKDLFPPDGETPCQVAKMYIELFYKNKENKRQLEQIDTGNYFEYFVDKLRYDVFSRDSGLEEKARKYFTTDVKTHVISGTISNVLMLIVLWDTASRIALNKSPQCCIVFENLDVIYNTANVPRLVKNVLAFRNNIDQLVTSLTHQGHSIGNPSHNYLLFFVMRETTTAEFSSYIDHFSDGKISFKTFTKISEIYNLHAIITRRVECLDRISKKNPSVSNNDKFNALLKKSRLIQELLTDAYLRKKLFSLFNNDYRTCVEVLAAFRMNDIHFYQSSEKMLQISKNGEDNWSAFAYRSIVFREIFALFVREGYIAKLRNFEYTVNTDGTMRSINLDRMILLYLSNSVTNKEVPEDEKDWQFVSLDKLFGELKKFCKNSDSIVEAL